MDEKRPQVEPAAKVLLQGTGSGEPVVQVLRQTPGERVVGHGSLNKRIKFRLVPYLIR